MKFDRATHRSDPRPPLHYPDPQKPKREDVPGPKVPLAWQPSQQEERGMHPIVYPNSRGRSLAHFNHLDAMRQLREMDEGGACGSRQSWEAPEGRLPDNGP
eukprot:GHVN01071501.1.p2 GENE.GHVN01071501.1~~GHVN01071501.1.p2  ORF type:complete len:101 (+),score=7.08 GHVN01071501.1:835-1137(+)